MFKKIKIAIINQLQLMAEMDKAKFMRDNKISWTFKKPSGNHKPNLDFLLSALKEQKEAKVIELRIKKY